jgi:hypothetical protein
MMTHISVAAAANMIRSSNDPSPLSGEKPVHFSIQSTFSSSPPGNAGVCPGKPSRENDRYSWRLLQRAECRDAKTCSGAGPAAETSLDDVLTPGIDDAIGGDASAALMLDGPGPPLIAPMAVA